MNYFNLFYNLALIKWINSVQTYFPIIPAFYAIYHLIKNKISILTNFFISIILIFSLVHFLQPSQDLNLIRIFQLVSLLIFADYSTKFIDEKEIETGFKFISVISLILIILQHFADNNIYGKYRFFWVFERVPGLSGEPNYTGATLLSIVVFFVYIKNYKWAFLVFILGLFSFSKGYILSSALIIFLLIYQRNDFKYLKRLSKLLVLIFFLYPFFLHLTFSIAPKNIFLYIYNLDIRIKSHLYYYFEVVENKPFGLGLGNNNNYYKENYKEYISSDVALSDNTLSNDMKIYHKNSKTFEQHNLPLQILSELGLAFYIILLIFIIFLLLSINQSWPILIILMPYFFLNGLNEILLYILIPYFIRKEKIHYL